MAEGHLPYETKNADFHLTESGNYGMLFAKSGVVYAVTGQKYAEHGLAVCGLKNQTGRPVSSYYK